MPVSLGFPNTPKKAITAIRWKRVLLKVSGRSLVGETLNVDPEVRLECSSLL
jgi:non-homologous end joining protein Ku